MERKAFTPRDLKLDDETGSVIVAFAQLNVVDLDRDVTLNDAFPRKSVPMSAYGHTSWMGELPTGKGTIREEGDWALFDGKFFVDTTQGRDAYLTVKAMGELQEWSYGYDPIDYAFEQRDGVSVRVLKRLDVFEVSPVLMGAGIGTHTRGIKGALGAALPFAEHLSLVADEASAVAVRAKGRADYRAKEGRVLSSANRERLSMLADALTETVGTLRALLEETDPEIDGKAASLARELEVLLEEARFNGVSV